MKVGDYMYDEIPIDVQMMIKRQFFNCKTVMETWELEQAYRKFIYSMYLKHVELLGNNIIAECEDLCRKLFDNSQNGIDS